MSLKIANAGGFWGDQMDAPRRLMEQMPDLDFLTIDYLAELSLGIMAMQRERDPEAGYARDFIEVVRSLAVFWKQGARVKVVANAGGLHPEACARACCAVLAEAGCFGMKIAVVAGDDVLPCLLADVDHPLYRHLEEGQSLRTVEAKLMSANAYLGAESIAEAIRLGAQIVITGRVADPSLTVGPCIAHYGWSLDEYQAIAGAAIAGHLIECGTQVTGGICTDWLSVPDVAHMGFPVAEIDSDGSCIITKPEGTGGWVNEETVKQQLLYEIGDPAHYLSPDATVSFLGLQLESVGSNRIAVRGAIGSAPPEHLKVSACARLGYRAEGQLVIFGADAVSKARRTGEVIMQRVRDAGVELEQTLVECLGAGDVVPGLFSQPAGLREVVLRVSAADSRRAAVERFTKEFAPLVTSGPPGVTGYATARPRVRPLFGYWPCLVERKKAQATVSLMEVVPL